MARYSGSVRTAAHSDERLPLSARVAREVLAVGAGGRLPIAADLQRRYDVGSGTVQRALSEVRDHGGVGMRSRGQRGTFVTAIDLPQLWALAQLGSVNMLLPATESTEMQGIIGALSQAIDSVVGADLTVSVITGSSVRIEAVKDGKADGAVMSSGALEQVTGLVVDRDPGVTVRGGWCIMSMGYGSYYRDGSVQVAARSPDRAIWKRIGVDSRSSDHVGLSAAEFHHSGIAITDVELDQVPLLVYEGVIDAGIWHRVATLFPPEAVGLTMLPLKTPRSAELLKTMSSAVIVTPEASPLHRALELIEAQTLVESRNQSARPTPPVSLRLVTHR